jgi:AraC-like DNA-binding protein
MKTDLPLAECTLDGARTKRWVLEAKECAAMELHRICRVGIDEAARPYRRVRLSPPGSFVLACIAGRGRILLEGRWQQVRPGMICLAPPRVPNAFQSDSTERWVFAWVRYLEPVFVAPVVGAVSPVIPQGDASDIWRIVEGLRSEWQSDQDPALLHHWLELLHGTIRRFARPWWRSEPRMAQLWDAVAQDLGHDWTLAELAHLARVSQEHLRRLCTTHLGRSPMQHLTYLRLQRARQVLETTDDKLDVIAHDLGYANAMVLSRVFKRWIGVAPGEYRGR